MTPPQRARHQEAPGLAGGQGGVTPHQPGGGQPPGAQHEVPHHQSNADQPGQPTNPGTSLPTSSNDNPGDRSRVNRTYSADQGHGDGTWWPSLRGEGPLGLVVT